MDLVLWIILPLLFSLFYGPSIIRFCVQRFIVQSKYEWLTLLKPGEWKNVLKVYEEMQEEKQTNTNIFYIMTLDLESLQEEELIEIRESLTIADDTGGELVQTYDVRLTSKGVGTKTATEEKLNWQPQGA